MAEDGETPAEDAELPGGHPVVLFDGVCNLCVGSVQFLIERDPEARFRFAPLQSEVGERLVADCGLDPETLDSIVLVDEGSCAVKSDAVMGIGRHLGGAYRLLSAGRLLPKRLRDAVYDFVAARRYGWFGRKDRCMMPTPDLRSRFLSESSGRADD
ncbi:thiol-disulfide oxidoreductase DCC family protein [Natronorarus salvus]|uniref:thiol-disulfide oxidoreductase DCC family protein n=1 Tax=Natronorarus salvus TaxID=3117733 RepID=UPI002F26633E